MLYSTESLSFEPVCGTTYSLAASGRFHFGISIFSSVFGFFFFGSKLSSSEDNWPLLRYSPLDVFFFDDKYLLVRILPEFQTYIEIEQEWWTLDPYRLIRYVLGLVHVFSTSMLVLWWVSWDNIRSGSKLSLTLNSQLAHLVLLWRPQSQGHCLSQVCIQAPTEKRWRPVYVPHLLWPQLLHVCLACWLELRLSSSLPLHSRLDHLHAEWRFPQ